MVVTLLLMVWAVPVAFTGFFSHITTLANSVRWLHWMAEAPTWLSRFVQGVLPQVVLLVLNIILPRLLRMVVGWKGLSSQSGVELSMQKFYFLFLFTQTFLTLSLSTSITAIIQDIFDGLDSVPLLVAQSSPKASNYFISYLLLQGLSVSTGTLLQVGGLVEWLILAPLLDRTPRQKWKRQRGLPQVQWGTLYPIYTNLACIGEFLRCILVR